MATYQMGVSHPFNPWDRVVELITNAGKILKLDNGMIQRIIIPERSYEVAIPVRLDSGDVEVFSGWRIQHDTSRGPGKGGIRFHQSVNKDEIAALAADMSIKTAVVNIPYGGAKGGVRVDPTTLSAGELERLTRRYAFAIAPVIGPDRDIPAPDVNTDAQVMSWVMDTVSMLHGHATFGVVTGKPLAIGGTLGHAGATSLGVTICTEALMKNMGRSPQGTRVIIQGYGKVGAPLVGYLVSRGFSVVGVADVHGAIHIPHGVNPEELARHVATTGSVVGLSGADPVDLTDFFTIDADIAIPAALGGVLDANVASRMKAGIVIEAANGPTTGDGAAVFADKKTIVVPDVLANAGGVVASYFEWAQDLQGMLWEPEVFTARLERTMKAAFDHVWQRHEAWNVILREAALAVGVERIAEATELRGLFP